MHNLRKRSRRKTEETAPKLAEQASSAIVIEQDTGKVLFDKNPNEKLPPASMTKIMTMLLIMEQVEKGKLKLNDKVRASEHAASMSESTNLLEPGEEMTVNEMLKGIAIASGNDASVAVAEAYRWFRRRICKYDEQKSERFRVEKYTFSKPDRSPG